MVELKTIKYEDVKHSTFNYFNGDSLATDVWMSKYALKNKEGEYKELNPTDMHKRISKEFARIEQKYPNPLSKDEIFELIKDFKYIIPGGSILYGLGNDNLSSLGNCFVVGNKDDSYGGIFNIDQELIQLMKRRSGVGVDISHLRPEGAFVSNTAGTSVGIIPFMERFSNSTREVSQSGRRGALMLSIDIKHPDVITFIRAKEDLTKITGANISVKVSDEFMEAVKKDLDFIHVFPLNTKLDLSQEEIDDLPYNELIKLNQYIQDTYIRKTKAKEIWDLIMKNTWSSAEPGLLFWDKIKEESPADCYEGFETTSTNPCLSGDTWVTTEDGPFQIKDLVGKGKIKLLKDGKFYETTEDGFFETGYKPVYEILLNNGAKIKATNNHKFLTDKGWVELKDVELGTKLILSNNDNVEWVGRGGTKEEGWLLGNFIGDGTFVNNSSLLQYWGDNKDLMLGKALNLLKILNFKKSEIKNPSNTDLLYNKVSIRSNDLYNLSNKWGIIKDNKYLTKEIEEGSSDFYKGILGGLFDADGCVWLSNGGITIDISQSNLPLLEQAQRMLFRLGINSTISLSHKEGLKLLPGPKFYENGEKKEYYCKNNYILRISNKFNVDKFFEKIYILDDDKISKYKDLIKKYIKKYKTKNYSKIKSISYIGTETVYDCTIPETSSFEANGIIVHNCGEIPLCPHDSCRLMSLNMFGFIENPFTKTAKINWDKFKSVAYKAQKLMDDIVDLEEEKIYKILYKLTLDPESEPIKKVELDLWEKILKKLTQGRRTGLSVIGIGDSLAALGLKYGTPKATNITEKIYKILAIQSYKASIDMAKERGAFEIYDLFCEKENPFINRILNELDEDYVVKYMSYGRRNISNLTIPPSGSLAILAQITSGIEPVFSLYYIRRRKVDKTHPKIDFIDQNGDCWEEYKVFHPKFKEWFYLNWQNILSPKSSTPPILEDYSKDQIQKIIEISPYHKVTANEIDYKEKIKMQGKVQKWVDHSISITHNLPKETTVEQVKEVYESAYKWGCKGCTIYRDGSRSGILINEENKKDNLIFGDVEAFKRPQKIKCHIYDVVIKGNEYIVLVGLINDKPYEVFAFIKNGITLPKIKMGYLHKIKRKHYNLLNVEEETILENITSKFKNPEEEAITRLVSTSLRHGANIKFIVEQLNKSEGDFQNFSKIIGRTLKKYIKDGEHSTELCPECNSKLKFVGGCVECPNCPFSKC